MSVAVIGAGASGLTAVKACLEEGLKPTCYEKCDYIGGLWHYTSLVVQIKETSDHVTTGRWIVTVKDNASDIVEESVYDFVMVCSGIFGKPNIPEVEGLSTFKGRVLHSHSYRDTPGFEDKNVLVVGFGNSAGDAAVDVAKVAKQVYMSSRNGGWLMQRVNKHGLPLDLSLSRAVKCLQVLAPNLVRRLVENRLNTQVDHKLYGFNPKMDINKLTGCVNDDLPVRVLHGAVRIKPDIKRFDANGVEFVDGSQHDVDSVIFATGYHVVYPFLSDYVLGVDKAGFYKCIFPTGRGVNSLAIIGCVRLRGGVLPVVEMQSRVAVRVFTEKVKLPSNDEMLKDVLKKKEENMKSGTLGLHFIQQADFVPYLDELADMIGCRPNIGMLLLRDFRFAMKCIFGPCAPYQYRLAGPHSWVGARDAILTLMDRVHFPLNPAYSRENTNKSGSVPVFKLCLVSIAIAAALYKIL